MKESRGASPVVMTIIMVAVTIVLAAILLCVVQTLGDSSGMEYSCGCGWTGSLGECRSETIPEVYLGYNDQIYTDYYCYYYCPDCGNVILRVRVG